jgi:hypothetical protein
VICEAILNDFEKLAAVMKKYDSNKPIPSLEPLPSQPVKPLGEKKEPAPTPDSKSKE